MWRIYGKAYDLTEFIDQHPGGSYILEKTRGLEDCTALFETYHAYSDIDKIQKILDKYEVKPHVRSKPYTTDFTQYRKLVKRVQTVYPTRSHVKANWHWTINNLMTAILAVFTFYICYISRAAFFYKALSQMVYAACESSLSFNIMHDGSHYAISLYPTQNVAASKIMNNILLWNANAWFFHHVYYHHSYTGLDNDPDNQLYLYDFPKTITSYVRKIDIINFLYQVLPGQQIGQAILYLIVQFTGFFHSNKTRFPNITYYDMLDIAMCFMKLYFIYRGGYILFAIYAITANTLYFMNVYPNHSSYETKIDNHYEGSDWARLQIANSGNFVMDNLWWTRIFGSINYQIEHHLFPNMSSIHYPEVSNIVKAYCIEHNIPYVNKATLYEAFKSFEKYVNHDHEKVE